MAHFIPREEILQSFRKRISEGRPVVGFGAGCGMTAKCAEKGGADYISIYTTAVCRIDGTPTVMPWLPYGNVNDDMRAVSAKMLPLIHGTPCIAGIGVHDIRIDIGELIDEFAAMGYSGVNNEPFCSMYGESFFNLLNRMGIGFNREIELMRTARDKGVLTLGWAADEAQARQLAAAGTDIVGVLACMERPGEAYDDYFSRVLREAEMCSAAARRENPDVITLIHGGPVNNPETAQKALLETGVDGYATGSSGERIPAENAIISVMSEYTGMRLRG